MNQAATKTFFNDGELVVVIPPKKKMIYGGITVFPDGTFVQCESECAKSTVKRVNSQHTK